MIQRAVLLAGVAVALLAAQGPARAALVSVPQSSALTATPTSFALGSGAATFRFTSDFTFAPGADVATGGSGTVSTIFGGLADFEAGSVIDNNLSFAAYPAATLIPNSQADDFIGLSYTSGGNTYYGYAEVSGSTLLGYAYQTTPGTAVTTASLVATAVPEPASFAVLALGALTVGGLRGRRRASRLAA